MKDNLFRAWQNGVMSNTFTFDDLSNGAITIGKDDVVAQFTGRLDNNGNRIFEGDIVKYVRKNVCLGAKTHDSVVFIGSIFWSHDKCQYQYSHKFKNGSVANSSIDFNDDRAEVNIVEVVGNIYEHPTLLEVLQKNLFGCGEAL